MPGDAHGSAQPDWLIIALMTPSVRSLACVLAAALTLAVPAHGFEFSDYDYNRFSREITACDRLAAHGRDPGHVAAAVSKSEMDKPAAIEACRRAVSEDPQNPRLNYQLGRALGYSNRGDEAMPYRLKAVELDYPQSTFVIGYLHLLGSTIEQDTCRAHQLWLRSAHYRRLAALVALPRHTLNGDFDGCPQPVSPDDMAAMLAEAEKLSSDYYTSMLIEVLQEKLAHAAMDKVP